MYNPSATYRLQFNSSFGFADAEKIAAYLNELGISTIYASPIFKARGGSTHGYDVTDANTFNPEVGSTEQFDALIETIHKLNMGWLQDFVPNHMAYDCNNALLMDIFEKGQGSPYFDFFDIVWSHLRENLRGKLIAPFLGAPYGQTLEKGEISLNYDQRGFFVKYYETEYPLRIESYSEILNGQVESLREDLGEEDPDFVKAVGIINTLANLPGNEQALERNAQIKLGKDLLWEMFQQDSAVHTIINKGIHQINSDIDALDALLMQQWFRLSHWRVATQEINYQRFFNINDLISLRMENRNVFENIHKFVFSLLSEGKINGLRLDHIDGLYDPTGYLVDLRNEINDAYIVVEKILEFDEQLPQKWPIQGTSGYDFMNHVNGVFLDAENEDSFQNLYEEFIGQKIDYEELLVEKKRLIIERHLTGDLDNLAYELKKISISTREGIDLAWVGLKRVLIETTVSFPVYRTYIDSEGVSDSDKAYIDESIAIARARCPDLETEFSFLEKVLLQQYPKHLTESDKALWTSFAMRFQQFTSPLMAKGLEDTTFYIFNRLISLNEVGGGPERFGSSAEQFHEWNRARQLASPYTMNATSTHDTKRGEDVRARLNVLSEISDEWKTQIEKWRSINLPAKKEINGEQIPPANQEYFLYQTLVGTFPFDQTNTDEYRERIKQYMIKAARESKTHTFWRENNLEFENALLEFIDEILASSNSEFIESFTAFQKRISFLGIFNSLSQTLLKIASPGVPDFYQGSELWDLSLVDPDNRRPVDYEQREHILREIKEAEGAVLPFISRLLEKPEDGGIKMFTIHRALNARRQHSELFESGEYIPLKITGNNSNNVIAFARKKGDQLAIIAIPRLLTSILGDGQLPIGKGVWQDTTFELPVDAPVTLTDVFTGAKVNVGSSVSVAQLFENWPLGFLLLQ